MEKGPNLKKKNATYSICVNLLFKYMHTAILLIRAFV